jgi:hypothetical protein
MANVQKYDNYNIPFSQTYRSYNYASIQFYFIKINIKKPILEKKGKRPVFERTQIQVVRTICRAMTQIRTGQNSSPLKTMGQKRYSYKTGLHCSKWDVGWSSSTAANICCFGFRGLAASNAEDVQTFRCGLHSTPSEVTYVRNSLKVNIWCAFTGSEVSLIGQFSSQKGWVDRKPYLRRSCPVLHRCHVCPHQFHHYNIRRLSEAT